MCETGLARKKHSEQLCINNNLKINQLYLALVAAILATPLCAQNLELVHRMTAALESRAVTKEYLSNPANADVVTEMRKRAAYDDRICCALLKADDASAIEIAFAHGPFDTALICSGNPKLLPRLSEFLLRDESPVAVRNGDIRNYPASVVAAQVIVRLIAHSNSFPPPVAVWANRVISERESDRGDHREEVRRWWAENKELILAGKYGETRPPSSSR